MPFVTFLVNGWLRLDGATGIVSVNRLPAVFGLLVVGVFSDGAAGQGWNMTGLDDYLGVAGQGVTGLFTVAGYQADFPGQLQAQVIGILALSLWGFLIGILVCAPLGLLLHGLLAAVRHASPVPPRNLRRAAPTRRRRQASSSPSPSRTHTTADQPRTVTPANTQTK